MSTPQDPSTPVDGGGTPKRLNFAQRFLRRKRAPFYVAPDYKMLNDGITALIAGRFCDAEAHFREAFNVRPSADAAFYLGHTLQQQAKYQEAHKYYELVDISDLTCREGGRQCFAFPEPPSLRLAIDRGRVLLVLGRTSDAIRAFREALEKHPSSAALQLGLSTAIFRSAMDALNSSALLETCEEQCRLRHRAAARELPRISSLDLDSPDVGIATEDAKALTQVANADLYFLQSGSGGK